MTPQEKELHASLGRDDALLFSRLDIRCPVNPISIFWSIIPHWDEKSNQRTEGNVENSLEWQCHSLKEIFQVSRAGPASKPGFFSYFSMI